MTAALVGAMEHAVPGTIFDGFPSYMVRYLLRRRGRRHARRAPPRLDVAARRAAAPVRARDGRRGRRRARASPSVADRFSRQLIEGFGWLARGGDRAPFDIPTELADGWGMPPARR